LNSLNFCSAVTGRRGTFVKLAGGGVEAPLIRVESEKIAGSKRGRNRGRGDINSVGGGLGRMQEN